MEKRPVLILLLFCSFWSFSQHTPEDADRLISAYPSYILSFRDNKLFFKDGTSMIYDDGRKKKLAQVMADPDIEDQFAYPYKKGKTALAQRNDAGRIRNEALFKKIYGNTPEAVRKKLVTIVWCPKLVNQKISITTVNGLDKIVKRLSDELDTHPEFKQYVTGIGGTFNWRKIAGTERLSMHSFGMTIDINAGYSNYWQWDCKCSNEAIPLSYKNRIPEELVLIFERYGFIWGGKWEHYDTMHFEYRPELLN